MVRPSMTATPSITDTLIEVGPRRPFSQGQDTPTRRGRYARRLPRDAELLATEAGCQDYSEREVDEVELEGGQVCLHLGTRRATPPRREGRRWTKHQVRSIDRGQARG